MTTCAERWKAEGIEKGIEKGKMQGKTEAILDVLRQRCGPIPEAVERSIREVSDLARLGELLGHAATCDDLDAFVAIMQQ